MHFYVNASYGRDSTRTLRYITLDIEMLVKSDISGQVSAGCMAASTPINDILMLIIIITCSVADKLSVWCHHMTATDNLHDVFLRYFNYIIY